MTEPTPKPGRGGPRPGAGRPRTGRSPRVLVLLPADLRARLRARLDPGESMSAAIVAAVRAEVARRERDR